MTSLLMPDGDYRDRALRLAARVQRQLLPRSVPAVLGFEFFAYYRAACMVSGDYYDFVPLSDDRLAIALGDVSGKDVPAALIGARFSGDTRHCVLHEPSPAHAAARLNRRFCEAGLEEGFITLSLGLLEVEARRLTHCSAGHPPLLIRRADGRIEELGTECGGTPLGAMPNARYGQGSTVLGIGDVVVAYSDGVTDARNVAEETYDSVKNPRLRTLLSHASVSPSALGRAIIRDIRAFSAGRDQFDDITLICFGPVGTPSGVEVRSA